MKYSKKFMLVPFIKTKDNPAEKYSEDLDSKMGDILTDKLLTPDEKVKLYNIALEKYKINYNNKPSSEESTSLNKISNHLESFIKDLKDEKVIKKNETKDEVKNEEKKENLNYNPDYYKLFNNMFDTTNLENTGYNEDTFNKSYIGRQNAFDKNRNLDSPIPMDVDKSPQITKPNTSEPITPKNSKNKVVNKINKKSQNTRTNYSPLVTGLTSNKITQKQASKDEPFKRNNKIERSPVKFSGKGLANTISTKAQHDCKQKWTSHKTGYF